MTDARTSHNVEQVLIKREDDGSQETRTSQVIQQVLIARENDGTQNARTAHLVMQVLVSVAPAPDNFGWTQIGI